VLYFEIHAGAHVTQRAGSHMFCIGPGLIKFAFEHAWGRFAEWASQARSVVALCRL
jgi:hypothetical protein